jgi:hypothetical protein
MHRGRSGGDGDARVGEPSAGRDLVPSTVEQTHVCSDDPVVLDVDARGLEIEDADPRRPVRGRSGGRHDLTVEQGTDIARTRRGGHAVRDSRLAG